MFPKTLNSTSLLVLPGIVSIYLLLSSVLVLAGGWTKFTPTPYDTSEYPLTSLNQPGTRLIYISASGNDTEAELYFWNGEAIVDSSGNNTGEGGLAYGIDPMNPSGPIKPFRRWPYVAPRRNAAEDIGTPWDGTGYKAPGENRAATRYEYPDWWLFKRGDTFDLYQDYLSFARETTPGFNALDAGTLAVSGGSSSSKRQIVGAYGNLSLPRPRFINTTNGAFLSRWADPQPKHITYLSLHFDGRGSDSDKRGGISFLGQNEEAVDIVFEDFWIDGGTNVNIQNTAGQFTFYRSIITDSYLDSHSPHVQGMYYSGLRNSRLQIKESILMRNGFANGDPMVNWPPSGQQYYDIYNRNLYLSGECENMQSGLFDSISMIGASGDQFRPGMRIENNFFYQGYVAMGAHGGYPDSDGPTGTIRNNVLQRFKGSGTDDNRGHPGWGFELTSGAYGVEVAGNVVTSAQHEADQYGLSLSSLGWYCYSHTFHYPSRNNIIHNNIFDTGAASRAINVTDGVENEYLECATWAYPGLTGNIFRDNTLTNSREVDWEYRPKESAIGTENDTQFISNTLYSSRAEAASAEGWPAPDRTLKTYLENLGHEVTTGDGFLEFFMEARQQRKGYWREEYTARNVVNYFRKGFGLAELRDNRRPPLPGILFLINKDDS